MPIVFGVTVVLVNVVWAFIYWRREQTILEMSKLLASRTLAEYSWLKSTESGKKPEPKPEAEHDGYDTIWEREE